MRHGLTAAIRHRSLLLAADNAGWRLFLIHPDYMTASKCEKEERNALSGEVRLVKHVTIRSDWQTATG